MDSTQILNEIAQEVKVCQKCELYHNRKNAVPGTGPENAEIMLIGEGPGFHENEKGPPFCRCSRQIPWTNCCRNAGLNREKVFITNVVKCRPPGNRDPLPEELVACGDYLDRQIETINPLVIVTLGRFSMAPYFPNGRISQIHGQPKWFEDRLIIPMYHPAAALHQSRLKDTLLEDFAKIGNWVEKARSKRPGSCSGRN